MCYEYFYSNTWKLYHKLKNKSNGGVYEENSGKIKIKI